MRRCPSRRRALGLVASTSRCRAARCGIRASVSRRSRPSGPPGVSGGRLGAVLAKLERAGVLRIGPGATRGVETVGLVHGQKRSSALEDRATLLARRAMHRSRRLVHHWAEIAVYLTSAVSEFTRPRIVSALRRSGRYRLRQARPSFGRGSVASAVVLFQAAASIPKYQCCHLGRSPAGQIPCER